MLSSEPPQKCQKRQKQQHISRETSATDDVVIYNEEIPEEQTETLWHEVHWERETENSQPQLGLVLPAAPKKPARTRSRGSSRGKVASGGNESRRSSGSPTDKSSDEEPKPRKRTHCHGGFEFTFRLWDDGVWRIEGSPRRIADTIEADIGEMVPETAQSNEDETSEGLLLEIGTGS
ncbi:hypothetical protein E4U31_001462 [Claviceps sp. LM219 group G6]|nr:hypothetical protein E4U31_001462 [Claviceps sp. LM219 group G6]KAG6119368.1 hypothetical protein E4U14_005443 [Claviceps sp. LM454 group G7]